MNQALKYLERIVAVALIGLLVLVAYPSRFFMPSAVFIAVLSGITALVFVWLGFLLTERANDEREETHSTTAGRAAYLTGAGMLTFALVYQSLSQSIDIWIPSTLAVMVLIKLATREYTDYFQ